MISVEDFNNHFKAIRFLVICKLLIKNSDKKFCDPNKKPANVCFNYFTNNLTLESENLNIHVCMYRLDN